MEKVKLGNILPYEQPSKYIVDSTKYNNSYKTPVLTAGKTFLLGYTDETNGIYDNLPCIIFDDFTTATKYVNFRFKVKSSAMKILTAKNDDVDLKYFYYLMQIIKVDAQTHKRFWISEYSKIEVYLPPLPEQRRIVEKIEELFSELDKGVEELTRAKERLKVYRQAVLKQAFEHIDDFDTIRSQTSLVTSGSRGWAKYYSDNGGKFIRIGNLTRDKISITMSDIQYVNLPDKAEGIRSKLEKGDILISITADLGSIGLVNENIGEAYINQHIALVRLNKPEFSNFYAHYLKSDRGNKELLRNKRGAGKLGLGLDDIKDAKIPIVTINVAEQIVTEIESRLSVCDKIEQTVNESLQKAESLRQSILKQAFDGKI